MKMHTPGPWQIENEGGNIPLAVRSASVSQTVATVWGAEMAANAALIAAAPELLAALEGALPHLKSVNWANKTRNTYTIAKEALKKARGER